MPPLRNVLGVARIVSNGTRAGVANVNVFHWAKDNRAPFSQTELSAAVGLVANAFNINFLPHIHTSYTTGPWEGVDLSSDLGLVAVAAGGQPGTALGAGPPSSIAQVISWKIARHYRGGHPRTYLPPPGDVAYTVSPTTWDDDHITDMNNAAVGFLNNCVGTAAGAQGRLVCVGRYRKNPETGESEQLDTPLVDNIIDASFDSRIDSQRRRLGPDR